VVVANALGGGVVESPAMDAYLPALVKALLGEELKFPDIATIWCGTEWGRKAALARLSSGMLRDAFDARPLFSRNSSARLGAEMTGEERADAESLIARRGETLVVQDIAPLGVAPVYDGAKFGARPVSLRVFAAWTPKGWIAMPGGLTRVAADDTVGALSMQSGASSKDAWVLSEAPVDNFTLLGGQGRNVEVKRHGESAPSRAMDNLFWLGRYAERTESLVRILRAVADRLGDAPASALELNRKLLVPFGETGEVVREPISDEAALARELQLLIYGRRRNRGLQRLLSRVESTAWSVRDRLSQDTWRTIHALTDKEKLPDEQQLFDGPGARFYLDALVRRGAALSGLSAENMTRGPNWLFMDLGRRIERALHLCWLVRQTVHAIDPMETEHMRIVLEIADSAMTYRSRYLGVFNIVPFVDLLLLDDANPRSVAFQLTAIEDHLRELPRITQAQRNAVPRSIAAHVLGLVSGTDPQDLTVDTEGTRIQLGELIDAIRGDIGNLSDAIADAYFQHSSRSRTGGARTG
jgi:uncharacterized alpha-E superfamily protein